MEPNEMRAGDGDRQAVADRLKVALDEGRLDLTEYDERLQKAYRAKTYGELHGLLDDLPGPAAAQHSQVQPADAGAVSAAHTAGQPAFGLPPWLRPYAGVVAVCV